MKSRLVSWIIFLLEKKLDFSSSILSVWMQYDWKFMQNSSEMYMNARMQYAENIRFQLFYFVCELKNKISVVQFYLQYAEKNKISIVQFCLLGCNMFESLCRIQKKCIKWMQEWCETVSTTQCNIFKEDVWCSIQHSVSFIQATWCNVLNGPTTVLLVIYFLEFSWRL